MAGLLGSMIAGAAKSGAEGRVRQIEQQEQFDLKLALMDAELEKQVMLKKMGFEMEDARATAQAEKRAGYFDPVEESTSTPESVMQKYTDENGVEQVVKSGGESVTNKRDATVGDAAERAFKSGDFESGEGLLKLGAKEKTFDSIKLDDGTVIAFDKSTGKTEVSYQGTGDGKSYKSIEEAIVNEQDPTKRAELIGVKKEIAAAGRAPVKSSDEDETYADWKRKPENKGKGRDDFVKEKATWSKTNEYDSQTVREEPVLDPMGRPKVGKDGKPIMTKSVTRKEPIPTNTGKPWERKF